MDENSVQDKRCCPVCGTEVTGDQKFCVNCGNKLPVDSSLMSSTNSLHDSATSISKINSAELVDDKSNKPDGMLLAGFILGICSWFLNFWGIVGLLAIVFSGISLGTGKAEGSRNKAFGYIGLVSGVVNVLYVVIKILGYYTK